MQCGMLDGAHDNTCSLFKIEITPCLITSNIYRVKVNYANSVNSHNQKPYLSKTVSCLHFVLFVPTELVIVGTGARLIPVHSDVRDYLKSKGIALEVQDTVSLTTSYLLI